MANSGVKTGLSLAVGTLLLAVAAYCTWRTIDGLDARRQMRTELAELGHVRYGLLNVDVWLDKLVPILEKKIDTIDLTPANKASLRPMVTSALYQLLDDVQKTMSAPPKGPPPTGFAALLTPSPALVKMIVGMIRPHVPEYADVVIRDLTKKSNKDALRKYAKSALVDAAKSSFGNVDKSWYNSILKQHACADAESCRDQLAEQIHAADSQITVYYLGALASTALAFVVLLLGPRPLPRLSALLLLLFCVTLLLGGILTPMLEVEAKLTNVGLTLLGEKITFPDQVLYFQSKSVLEVFDALIHRGRPDMIVVAVLVLTFSIIFPSLKILFTSWYISWPDLVRKSRIAHFFVLESSKWSMADVMAIAIFMAFVAFNGIVTNTLGGLTGMGMPTDSSKILPGYHLFIGFCLASLFLSKKLAPKVAD